MWPNNWKGLNKQLLHCKFWWCRTPSILLRGISKRWFCPNHNGSETGTNLTLFKRVKTKGLLPLAFGRLNNGDESQFDEMIGLMAQNSSVWFPQKIRYTRHLLRKIWYSSSFPNTISPFPLHLLHFNLKPAINRVLLWFWMMLIFMGSFLHVRAMIEFQ